MISPCKYCGNIPAPKIDLKYYSQVTPDCTLIYKTSLECCGVKSFGGSIELGIEDWNDLQEEVFEIKKVEQKGQLSLF